MIEEIQALMPILEKISDGAMWAFLIFMLTKTVGIVVWPVVLCFGTIKLAAAIVSISRANNGQGEIDLYYMKYEGKSLGYKYIGDFEDISKLFALLGRNGKFIHSADVQRVISDIEKIRKGNNNG